MPVLLTDGGIETRLIYEFHCPLPDFASFLPLFDEKGRGDLTALYGSYLAIAAEFRLPMQIGTPTWRAHPEGLARQGFRAPDDLRRVNETAVRFLRDLRREMAVEDLVLIAGVIGPRLDGYDPQGAPKAAEAEAYHRPQAAVLAEAGVDLLYAPTFASADELLGVAQAMAATGLGYAVAPVIDDEGLLPDGTALKDAVQRIDHAVSPSPLHWLIGCVHPARLRSAHEMPAWPSTDSPRIRGLKANASSLPPDELDRLDHLDEGHPSSFADEMLALHHDFGLRVLGGCCGTDHRHIRALAERLTAKRS